LIYWNRWSYQN